MAAALTLEIVTPEKLVFSQEVEMAVLPGTEGVLGVLANHAPSIVELKEGEISIYASANDNAPKWQFSINDGFAEIRGQKCTILADKVSAVD